MPPADSPDPMPQLAAAWTGTPAALLSLLDGQVGQARRPGNFCCPLCPAGLPLLKVGQVSLSSQYLPHIRWWDRYSGWWVRHPWHNSFLFCVFWFFFLFVLHFLPSSHYMPWKCSWLLTVCGCVKLGLTRLLVEVVVVVVGHFVCSLGGWVGWPWVAFVWQALWAARATCHTACMNSLSSLYLLRKRQKSKTLEQDLTAALDKQAGASACYSQFWTSWCDTMPTL